MNKDRRRAPRTVTMTIRVPIDVMGRVKIAAKRRGKSLEEHVNDALLMIGEFSNVFDRIDSEASHRKDPS